MKDYKGCLCEYCKKETDAGDIHIKTKRRNWIHWHEDCYRRYIHKKEGS